MGNLKVTHVLSQVAILLLCALGFNPWIITAANAQGLDKWQLERSYKVEPGSGSRLKTLGARECKSCAEKELKVKFEYLKRALSGESSSNYQKEIESIIFANAKFVNGCWKNAYDKGMEIFFTVSESGKASDFAWFPKHKAGKCIKQHVSKIEFPGVDKPYHAWLVVSGTAR